MSTPPHLLSTPPPTESLSTSLPATPKSTLIFSNSFTSNTLGEQYSPPLSAEQNWSVNSTPASPLYALLPSPSFASPSTEARFNLSTPSPLPTDFYLLFKDGYLDKDDQSKVSLAVRENNTIDSLTLDDTGQAKSPKSIFLKASNNFWSDILTTSLSPQIETLVEYVLIGMLAFVLLQIAIAYLLASEIRTLRTELAMFAAMPQNKGRLELEEAEEPHLLAAKEDTKLSDFEKDAYESSAYCQLQCFDPSTGSGLPLQEYSTTAHHSANYGPDFCLLTFQQAIPMVQVHANPDTTAAPSVLAVAGERGNSFNSNYVNVIIDETLSNKPSQFASIVSSSALTSKTNRRNRMGSFRVTFAGESLTENSPATGTEEEEREAAEKEEASERHHHSTYYKRVQQMQGTEVHQHQQQQHQQFGEQGQHYQP